MAIKAPLASLEGKHVLLGVSGGIAAYKSAVLARLLIKAGARVKVVMTSGAQAFITPLTFQALTGEQVHDTLLDPEAEAGMGHIELARWADLILIAPASANLIARIAHGHADDLLTTLCLASPAPRVMAPAMNQQMWANPLVQCNVRLLNEHGWQLLGPAQGEQACGDVGSGRMLEPEDMVAALSGQAQHGNTPASAASTGLHVVITAGPTREAIDPVRYLTNHSSGKMGYALAAAALAQGARVTLISGPVQLDTPAGAEVVSVMTADDMLSAAQTACQDADIFIAAAAVADFRAASVATSKLKKGDAESMTLELARNPDIVATIKASQKALFTVGFAAETDHLVKHAGDKMERKQLDMVVANQVGNGKAFNQEDNAATLLWKEDGSISSQAFTLKPKRLLADELLAAIITHYQQGTGAASIH